MSPSGGVLHPEAEFTALADKILVDSFQLALSVERVETNKQKVLTRLGTEFNIEECEAATDIETLLELELDKSSHENAFYLCDLGTVVRKYEQWTTLMPNVRPFYAVKSNPDVAILKTLKLLGTGFDCASQQELQLILGLGVDPRDIIFANPCKMKSHIEFARDHGVTKMTFDNIAELRKIAQCYVSRHEQPELILRILPPDSSSALCNFGSKFGASREMTRALLKEARKLDVNLVGVSFHVGSGCLDAKAYIQALRLAHEVIDTAVNKFGFSMKYLDIGGGFPAADNLEPNGQPSFPTIVSVIKPFLEEYFPRSSGISVIAEPGRYLCGEAFVLCVNVIAKRSAVPAESAPDNDETNDDDQPGDGEEPERILYYLADGIYGSFNNIMFDHQTVMPQLLSSSTSNESRAHPKKSTLFGPTCDSIDVICRDVSLPDIEVGSWLYFLNMGAYTRAAASSFNGFTPPSCRYMIT